MSRLAFTVLLVSLVQLGCGSQSPSAPSGLEGPSPGYRGEAVGALDGRPVTGVTARIGEQTVVANDSGYFELSADPGSRTLILSGPSIVERQKLVTVPTTAIARDALIPASFDLAAFDEMFRGTGRLQRWTSAPALVVLGKVMQFENFTSEDARATGETLPQGEIDLLVTHLQEGLALLTANTFTFSSIQIETPATNEKVATVRQGQIVVGRFRGVQTLGNTIGYGRFASTESGEVAGGAVYLDREFDQSGEARRLLRIHELGHALGYLHVNARTSIMNPAIGPQPTEFDRQAARIAFQRLPGNLSPDRDPGASPPRSGGIFGARGLTPVSWSPPVICGITSRTPS